MFDFSFGELAVIGAVSLVVLGPEKLPVVARNVGQWLGKAQRYVNDVKADIQREGELAELRKFQEQVQQSAREIEGSMKQSLQTVQEQLAPPTFDEPPASLSLPDDMHAIAPPPQLPGSALRRQPAFPSLDDLARELAQLRASLGQPASRSRYVPRARSVRARATSRGFRR
jgi:sec-independent protein translocase protein TatB